MAKYGDKVRDPFGYLEADHKKMDALLEKLKATKMTSAKKRRQIFGDLHSQMTLHIALEETVVYPMLDEWRSMHDIAMEGYAEHHVLKLLLGELAVEPADTEEWGWKAKVLKENEDHHVDEEEDDMFPKARKALSKEQKERLARKMENYLRS